MAVRVYGFWNLQAVDRNEGKAKAKAPNYSKVGKRSLLLFTLIATSPQVPESRTQLLQKYLKKSEQNKEKNDKERLESYYKRNYKDYFDLMEGTLKGKEGQLSDTEKGILDWLKANK
ncbi:Photosystem I reaction centre subunit N [Senna tora]|uniref:Photosystem I reaction centre subunit N n=1 Tax=Senna tora TaxID=362788 RepID=A0A835CGH5_9FABA|nr:Photosystem I reaction centre subunit N [Senna tora]